MAAKTFLNNFYEYILYLHIFDACNIVLSKIKTVRIKDSWKDTGFFVLSQKVYLYKGYSAKLLKKCFIHFTCVKMKNSKERKTRFFWLAYFSAKNTFQEIPTGKTVIT